MESAGTIPAAALDGVDLGNGWRVLDKVTRKPGSTGGNCSIGYRVQRKDGKVAFLKALDLSKAFKEADLTTAIQEITELYNFERSILNRCKDKHLNRIVTPILDGTVTVPGFGALGAVPYIIFELASGDIRDALTDFGKLDLLWCLKSLHNVTVGISQLHGIDVAHQDLKPSNVLVVEEGSKVSDLGSASDRSKASPNDTPRIPGARSYAPIDQWYEDSGLDGFPKKLVSDLYLLGSLFFFHFATVSATHAIRSKLQGKELPDRSFREVLPYLQYAFEEAIIDLKQQVQVTAGPLTEEIVGIVKQLC